MEPSDKTKITYMPEQLNDGKAGLRVRAFLVVVIVCCILSAFAMFLKFQYETLLSVEQSIAHVEREIAEQQLLTESLRIEKAMYGTAEYFERIARERLGLVYRNEIHFRRR